MKPTTRSRLRTARISGVALSGMALVASAGAIGAPTAEAYNTGYGLITTVSTSRSCTVTGPLEVRRTDGGCRLFDSADNTVFKDDRGGRAVKIEFHSSGKLRAKAEFHPYGEKLWVYDNSRDGDTVHFRLEVGGIEKTYAVPKGQGHQVYDLDLSEGQTVELTAYDDAAGTDLLGSAKGRA